MTGLLQRLLPREEGFSASLPNKPPTSTKAPTPCSKCSSITPASPSKCKSSKLSSMKVIVRSQRPLKVDRWFRRLQLFSAALFSLGHGTNDSQKGMGMITAALVSSGLLHTTAGGKLPVPFWVIICCHLCHLAMGGGTMAGGWRIILTIGQPITKL